MGRWGRRDPSPGDCLLKRVWKWGWHFHGIKAVWKIRFPAGLEAGHHHGLSAMDRAGAGHPIPERNISPHNQQLILRRPPGKSLKFQWLRGREVGGKGWELGLVFPAKIYFKQHVLKAAPAPGFQQPNVGIWKQLLRIPEPIHGHGDSWNPRLLWLGRDIKGRDTFHLPQAAPTPP